MLTPRPGRVAPASLEKCVYDHWAHRTGTFTYQIYLPTQFNIENQLQITNLLNPRLLSQTPKIVQLLEINYKLKGKYTSHIPDCWTIPGLRLEAPTRYEGTDPKWHLGRLARLVGMWGMEMASQVKGNIMGT